MDHVLNLYQPNTNQQQQQLQAQNSQSSSNLILLSQGSSNNAAPLEIMEVDPQSLSSINHSNNSSNNPQQTISSSSSTVSSVNLQQRYGHPQHMHHRSRGSGYPTSLLGVPQNLLMAANNVSGNANSRTSSNSLLNNYASLPVDLGQISSATLLSNSSVSSGLDQHHPSLHGYPSHHMTSSNTTSSSNNGAFGPFSSIQDATTLQMQRSTNSVTRGSSNNNSGNNDTDETPMVGVCIQQSPVVIH